MELNQLYNKALDLQFISFEESFYLYKNAPLNELMFIANELRNKLIPHNKVTWIIDRNINTTNVCIANCKFCNFYRIPGHKESYITDIETYKKKIDETFKYGGEQLLLQGGHHPDLGLNYYVDLFSTLKKIYPKLKLHALGPPEIAHIAKISNKTHLEVLTELKNAGLDSLPGPGAEILVDRVRRLISKGKCASAEWLEIMRVAHKLNLTTSATMMFGHVETVEERLEHIIKLRDLQNEKPKDNKGFIAFILWPFQDVDTLLTRVRGIHNNISNNEYIRMLSLSRIMLTNITNIQVSWLTVGKAVGQICLHAGANDFGSIMIEENVVSAAGAPHRFTYKTIQKAIKEAGFEPQLRNQQYEFREIPKNIEEQIINY